MFHNQHGTGKTQTKLIKYTKTWSKCRTRYNEKNYVILPSFVT